MKIFREQIIKADPKKIIEYISNVKNHPAFISALKSVENISGDPKQIGTTWDWTFVMAGVEIKGKGSTESYEEGKKYSFKTSSGIDSTFTYSVVPDAEGAKLTMEVEYEIPDNVLSKVADKAVIERLNQQDEEKAIENIKAILEV